MKVVIDCNKKNEYVYKGFTKYKSLAEIKARLGSIDTIVIHEFTDTTCDVGLFLSLAKKEGVKRFIYINSQLNDMINLCVKSLGGIVESDEGLLEEDTLEYLIAEYESMSCCMEISVSDGISILDDFIAAFVRNEDKVNNSAYLERVQAALVEVKNKSIKDEMIIRNVSEIAMNIFTDINSYFENTKKANKELQDKVYDLSQKISEDKSIALRESALFYYPKVHYTGTKRVLHIKEKVECKYLLSFLLAYQGYVMSQLRKKLKVIVTYQKFKDTYDRYYSATIITKETSKNKSLVSSGYVVVNQPKKEVLYDILNSDDDIYIILDRMYGEDIIVGGSVRKLYATSGVRAMLKAKIPADKCILSGIDYENLFLAIPVISNYPQEESDRKHAYFNVCKESYHKLNKFLGIGE